MKYVIWIILVGCSMICIIFCGCGCKHSPKRVETQKDDFYTDIGGSGRPRVPLLEPYELLKVSATEWRMELQTISLLALSIHQVKGVAVTKDLGLIYSKGGTELRSAIADEAWFIINPALSTEYATTDYRYWQDTLKTLGVTGFRFLEPGSVYKKFADGGGIIW